MTTRKIKNTAKQTIPHLRENPRIFSLAIKTSNTAFDESSKEEIVRILEKLIGDIRQDHEPEKLYDINGNRCGEVIWKF